MMTSIVIIIIIIIIVIIIIIIIIVIIIIIIIIIITINSLVSDHSWCTTKWSLTRSGSYKRIDCITIDIVGYKLVVQGSFWV